MQRTIPFLEPFSTIDDPRIERHKVYPLDEIIFTALCAYICGADSWRDLVTFGNEKIDFLIKYLPYKNGIPSKNTFARVFAAMDSEQFKNCFVEWTKSFEKVFNSVAIDGKCLRRSHDYAKDQSAIHMVSAFATEARLVLGQVKVDDKSNEITAIPKLLDLLNLKGLTVTIDAMGCQKSVAKKIIDGGGEYVFSLKGNQEKLNHEVRALFESLDSSKLEGLSHIDFFEESDKGHGRIETRKYYFTDCLDTITQKSKWPGLASIGMIESRRLLGDQISFERRFVISSLLPIAKTMAKAIRNHWGIENSLHWTLDMVFNEDQSRIRSKNAATNMATLRHCAMNMLQKAKTLFKDCSLKGLRKKAGWGGRTLERILQQNF